jgi:TetR/AcrR family transcriptional regulator, fatty acid metabolism regulator protein
MTAANPHSRLKERQRQERANLILETAASVLSEKGYYETSMEEIAAQVGVAKGTLYQHFANKEELVFALFEHEIEETQQMVDQIVRSDLSARMKLETLLLWTYQGFTQRHRQLVWTLYDSLDIRKSVLEERLRIREHMELLLPSIESIFSAGKVSGEFDPSISVAIMLTTFVSLLSPRIYEFLIAREHFTPEELVKQVGRTFFQGIVPQGEICSPVAVPCASLGKS